MLTVESAFGGNSSRTNQSMASTELRIKATPSEFAPSVFLHNLAKKRPPELLPAAFEFMAPQVGLEPTTLRLTAECSAIELLRNKRPHMVSKETMCRARSVFIAKGSESVNRSRTRSGSKPPRIRISQNDQWILNSTAPVKCNPRRRRSV